MGTPSWPGSDPDGKMAATYTRYDDVATDR